MGPAVAVGFLQRSLNALNRNGRDWADLAVDRSIGPATLGALRALLRVRGQAAACVLVRAMNALQGARDLALSEARPTTEPFAHGRDRQSVGLGQSATRR